MMTDLISARRKLSRLWFLYSVTLFFIFFLLSMYSSRFDNVKKEAWEWFLPNIVPTLTVITGVFIADLADTHLQIREIPDFFVKTAYWISVVYLTVLGLVILNPVSKIDNILLHYQEQSVFLIPLQTITTTFIGIFFSKTGRDPKKKKNRSASDSVLAKNEQPNIGSPDADG